MDRFIVSLLLSICVSATTMAESVTCVEGGLETAVADLTTSELVVSGAMDVRDFSFIAEKMHIRSLDISAVSIKGYSCTANETYFGQRSGFVAGVIPAYGFFGSNIETIKLPTSLKGIGEAAFAGCKSLHSIVIPASVESIGASAFYASAITSADIQAKTVGSRAFAKCDVLHTVSLGSGVETIGDLAFAACSKLATVAIADASRLASIGDEAFSNTAISKFDFSKCTEIKTVGKWAFANTAVTEAVLPDRLAEVPEGVYFGSKAATSIVIPKETTDIAAYAYYGSGAKSVTIPAKVEYIGDNAFEGVPLTDATAKPTTVPALGKDVFRGVNTDNRRATLYVNVNLVNDYRNAGQWREFAILIDPETSVGEINGDTSLKAFFEGVNLHIEAMIGISKVQVVNEAGVTVAEAAPQAETAIIDTGDFGGSIYIASVTLADGSIRNIKLLRK